MNVISIKYHKIVDFESLFCVAFKIPGRLTTKSHILFVVELAIAEMACVSSTVPFLSALRSGLLTFFSSLVIQESLINFAGERRRSKTGSHCESVFVFCLSASRPKHSNSKKQKRRLLPVVAARLVPSPLRYSGPVIRF